ncbi:hypothetical protein HY450_00720 [Candidatus Pacearchaeota archaeon]|nr:hypothetical protein [Candidatus Pacearchaeota archaeon]
MTNEKIYLKIEELDEEGEVTDRKLIYLGEVEMERWKEKLKGEPKSRIYFLTEFEYDNTSLQITTRILFKEESYDLDSSDFNSVSIELDDRTRSLLQQILTSPQQEQWK